MDQEMWHMYYQGGRLCWEVVKTTFFGKVPEAFDGKGRVSAQVLTQSKKMKPFYFVATLQRGGKSLCDQILRSDQIKIAL